MSNLSIFLNTKVEDSGILSYIGNKGLAPVRYLSEGKTYKIIDGTISSRTSFEAAEKKLWKTVAAVVLLIPGLFLSLFKLAAYISSDVRTNHSLIEDTIIIDLSTHLGSFEKPIKNEDELAEIVSKKKPKSRRNLVIHGDGQLEINRESGILEKFKPQILILVGAKIRPSDKIRFDDQMQETDQWDPYWSDAPIRMANDSPYQPIEKATIDDALTTPLKRKGRWPSLEFYNGLFYVPRPVHLPV